MADIALTIGLLFVLLMALLAIPLTVMFSIYRNNQTEGQVHIRWLFGLVRFKRRIPQVARIKPQPAHTSKKKPKPHKRNNSSREIISILKRPAFRRHVYNFIRRMLTAIHARDLFLHLRIGLGDPADTGRLWAIIGPIAGIAQNLRSIEVLIEPEFMDPLFEIKSHGQIQLVPLQFIGLTIAFILSPTMIRTWWRLNHGNT